MSLKNALLVGASGETGQEVLKQLQLSPLFAKIILIGRRNLDLSDASKVEQRVINFDDIDSHSEAFQEADIGFCCLGTTREKAGKEGFIKVDRDYVLNSAQKALAGGCRDFHVISSQGAKASSMFLYMKIKGQVDEALQGMDFHRVSIYRPGVLICDRAEFRWGDRIARSISSVVDRSHRFSIPTPVLAQIIVANSLQVIDQKCEILEQADITKRANNALLVGASGETGQEVLKQLQLSPQFAKIILIGRRNLDLSDASKVEQRVIDFDDIDSHSEAFQGADIGFCCLGTTRGKAGKEGFIKVDRDYVLNSAQKALAGGCRDFHLVSSQGANASSMFLYTQIKGQVDEALQGIDFHRVSIYRPGLLMCDRTESRWGERIARSISSVVDKSHRFSIPTTVLAQAIVANSLHPIDQKSEILEHADITKKAK
eukprot:TCALIF_11041-PA protein Name:"Similar to HTATIP2 Oxidoreductase HTATIP2 (Gorilla gorilla gorilla)" AED:0.13 eAED:0.14 QI:32/0.33/0.25/1/0.66/0.5/4/64/428